MESRPVSRREEGMFGQPHDRKKRTGKEKSYKKGQLLFHPSHGICRIRGIVRRPELTTDGLCYWIEPKGKGRSTVCFFITRGRLAESGFHIPASEKKASEIVDYLKKGEKQKRLMGIERVETLRALAKKNNALVYARVLHMIIDHQDQKVGREMRQFFKYYFEGLVRELSFSLRLTVSQASTLVKASLQERTKLEEWILKIIDSVEE